MLVFFIGNNKSTATSIAKVCKEECGTAFGYQWRYFDNQPKQHISSTVVNEGKSLIIEYKGKKYGLHEICLILFDEKGYQSIRSYFNYAKCTPQQAFDRYLKSNGATRSGQIIEFAGNKYSTMKEASNVAGISYNRVCQAKAKFNFTPQQAFDYCLSKQPMDNHPHPIYANGTCYPSITSAIKGTRINPSKFYKYKKENCCTAQEAFDYLLNN